MTSLLCLVTVVDAIKFIVADDVSMWRRWVWYVAAAVSVVSMAGLVVIMRFLQPLTLEAADQWASVGAMLLAYLALVGGALVWLIRWAGQRLDPGRLHAAGLRSGRKGANGPRPEVTEADRNGIRRSLPVPRQLPPDVSHFTGRQGDLTRLDGLLDAPGDRNTTMVISAVAGTAGVGKPRPVKGSI